MRSVLLACLFLLPLCAAAEDFTIKVVDPNGAAVAGARVEVLHNGTVAAVTTTSAEGSAAVHAQATDLLRVQAPGFVIASGRIGSAGTMTIHLQVAATPETVSVSATQTPIESDASGTPVESLDERTLTLMQPFDAAEALRFVPGVVLSDAGRRGGQSSIFVRGGDSRYNKVIIDGVPVNDPGGTFDFGVVPMQQFDRVEMVRGAESALYGSDAMTSTVQFFSASGSTETPEFRFGADGGNYSTAHGYASFAGALRKFDYNVFADQANTNGQGINDDYSNSSQGGNLGYAFSRNVDLRLRIRHSNSRSGVQSFWNFNGQPLVPPDADEYARQNNLLGSLELTIQHGRFRHTLTGYDYNHHRLNIDQVMEAGRVSPAFGNFDFPFSDFANINRAGLQYQGEFSPRTWTRTLFGYQFEDENGFVGDLTAPPLTHGLRRNQEGFLEQVFTFERASLIAGIRGVGNESFGTRAIPRVAASYLLLKGGQVLSGTRLRFAYGEGIKEPRFEETFGQGGFGIIPNPALRAERNRSVETGFTQELFGTKASFAATYFHNLFRDQIAFNFDPVTFVSQYLNLNRALAHGAELEFHARPNNRLSFESSYTYTSTQVLDAPNAFDPLLVAGKPLLRRPKHSGSMLVSYSRARWAANLGGTFVGRRADSDFLGFLPPVTYSAGYARFDAGGWYALTSRVSMYANVENLFNRKYEEAAGFPALHANVRAGLRFRLGGER